MELVLGKLDEGGVRRAVITRNNAAGIVQLQEVSSPTCQCPMGEETR